MASSSRGANRGFRAKWPQWSLLLFVALLVLTYVLVFFTGNREATPKLGIDLQGGTRVTLVPQGEQPTQDQLDQARRILENRVNGMGVTGAQVVTDGDTLVITVPGEDSQEARALGQTSQLFFRPVATPENPDEAALAEVTKTMADDWVEVGLLTPEDANANLKELHDQWGKNIEERRTAFEQQNPDEPVPADLQRDLGPVQPFAPATPTLGEGRTPRRGAAGR